jgi:hypothetical protein
VTPTAAGCDHIFAPSDTCLAQVLATEHAIELAQYPEPPWPRGAPQSGEAGVSRP